MNKYYQQLTTIFTQLYELEHLLNLASWDEAVMMPKGGGVARAKAISTLTQLRHEILASTKVKQLLKKVSGDDLDNDWDRANLRLMSKHYHRANALPSKLIKQLTQQTIQCEQLWRELRPKNDWIHFSKSLQKTVALVRQAAAIRSQQMQISPYDVLLDDFSPGFSKKLMAPIFKQLTDFLPEFIRQITQKQSSREITPLHGPFAIDKQRALSVKLMKVIGFDFNYGRLDTSHHPFSGGIPDDVRITTRYSKEEIFSGIMGICHETGHAMYDRGLPREYYDQPVGQATDMALHESQSLLIEMQVCRSRSFLAFLVPLIQHYFGEHPTINLGNIYNIYTQVKPSLIRVDADEVTYPLHIIMRYEIEKQLLEEDLSVSDLPDIWDHYMMKFFNISTKNNFQNGIMQDAHWPAGQFGYFPSYTLGSLMAAQFYQHAVMTYASIPNDIGQGNFSNLFAWLRSNVHSKGLSISSQEILKQATGSYLEPKFFIEHLHKRYQS